MTSVKTPNLTLGILILLGFLTRIKPAAGDNPYWFILSINQTVTQSSTAVNGEASKAVDGKASPKPASCSLTNAATNVYIVIDFGRTIFAPLMTFHIDESVKDGYKHAVIKIGDDATHTANPTLRETTLAKFGYIINHNQRGRYWSIDVTTTDAEPLSICELFVYRLPIDSISFKKPVAMSKEPNQPVHHSPRSLVDMIWNTLTMTHAVFNAWIRLDLLDTYYVAEVIFVPYGGHDMPHLDIRVGESLEKNGRRNPSCVKDANFGLGEAKSLLCGMKGRYVVLTTDYYIGKFTMRATELIVNPSHVDNIAEGMTVTIPNGIEGFDSAYAATDCRMGAGVITNDVGTGHWLMIDLRSSFPVAKIFIVNIVKKIHQEKMVDFELRVGDSLTDNGKENPYCLPGLQSILRKVTASFFCVPRVTGRYVSAHTTAAGKHIALTEMAVYSESPPEIKDKEKSREIWLKEGSVQTLSCEAYGYPIPVISWLKDGVLIQNNSNTIRTNRSGTYECWANNTHGMNYKPIEVRMTSVYRPCVESVEVPYDLGGSADAYPKKTMELSGHKWHRFYDSSVQTYLQMANKIPNNSSVCGGWVSGAHPVVRDGVVERNVCVKENGKDCHRQLSVRIRNCGIFYIYNLPPHRETDGLSFCFNPETRKVSGAPGVSVMSGGANNALSNHVFQVETEINDSSQCLLMCSLAENCHSFNFSWKEKICELNSSTKDKHPANFLRRNGYHYYMKGKGLLLSRKLGDL